MAGGLVYLSLVALFVGAYGRLKRVWLLLLPVAFFFSPRSLSSYLVDLFAAGLLAALSVADAPRRAPASRVRRARRPSPAVAVGLLGGLGGLFFGALAFAGPPLRLSVVSSVGARGGSVGAVTVSVRNLTGGTVAPHFLVNMGGNPNGFWLPRSAGAVRLGPHGTETVTLYPPVWTGAPKKGAHWLVEAYTASRQLSVSSLQDWTAPGP